MDQMAHKRDKAGLDNDLKGMFRALAARPLPDRLLSVVDQLDEGEPKSAPAKKSA